jgi:hypothetical protein
MASRKRKRPTTSVKIDVDAHGRLDELQTALGSLDLPSYVEQMEIVSALVMFTTPEQLAGMLFGYWRYTNRLLEEREPQSAQPGTRDKEAT